MDDIELGASIAARRQPRMDLSRFWARWTFWLGGLARARRSRSLASMAAHQIARAVELGASSGGAAACVSLLELTEKSFGALAMEQAMRARCWRGRAAPKKDEWLGQYWMMTPAMAAARTGSPKWAARLGAMIPPEAWRDRIEIETSAGFESLSKQLESSQLKLKSVGPLLALCIQNDEHWAASFPACRPWLPAPSAAEAQACRLALAQHPQRLAQFESWQEELALGEAVAAKPTPSYQKRRSAL
jgi:hypothetical protein